MSDLLIKVPLPLLALALLLVTPAIAQDWRAAADARIEQHRKADLTVRVQDAAGNPLEGASVDVQMQRHAFRFGSAVRSELARSDPRMELTSGDLDLGEKLSAVRFQLDVERGATIGQAHVQFLADKNDQAERTQLRIRAVAADDAVDFNAAGVSTRPHTTAEVMWEVPAWTTEGERAAPQRTPDLAPLLQEVVNRPGWQRGNHLVLVFEGFGKRSARTIDKGAEAAAELIVEVGGETRTAKVATTLDDAEQPTTINFSGADAERYRELIPELFNYATLGNALKWRPWERDSLLASGAIQWLQEQGLDVRGHTMIWSSLRWNAIPEEVEARMAAGDAAYVRDRAAAHVAKIAAAYSAAEVPEWDVVNEPLHETDLEQVIGFDERVRWFQLAHAQNPDARLFINDFDILEGPARVDDYKRLIQDLIAAGAPVEGVGMQGHFLGGPPTPEQLVARLASLAELGLPLQITEFDMNSSWSEAQQARFTEDVLVAAFAEPAVTAFIMWGFWDGNHWLGNAPLYRRDWSLKPSGQTYLDLVFDAWWTDETLGTDATGAAGVRGFKGDYSVVVTRDGVTAQHSLALRGDTTLVITLDAGAVSVDPHAVPGAFAVGGPFPNPCRNTCALALTLDAPATVRVDVYDVVGRRVRTRTLPHLAAGEHEVRLDADGLAGGAYLVRVAATRAGAEDVRTSTLLLTP